MIRPSNCAAALFIAVFAASGICAQPASSPQYSKSELKQLIRTADTREQYQTLAAYYRARQLSYEEQAHSQKVEWERLSLKVTGPVGKYPRPVDASRNRYEYFTYKAQQMSQQAEHFENLAAK
jgi:hypothetical protein